MGLDGGLMGLMESFFIKGIKSHQGSIIITCVDSPLSSPLLLKGRGNVPLLFTPPLAPLKGRGNVVFMKKGG